MKGRESMWKGPGSEDHHGMTEEIKGATGLSEQKEEMDMGRRESRRLTQGPWSLCCLY